MLKAGHFASAKLTGQPNLLYLKDRAPIAGLHAQYRRRIMSSMTDANLELSIAQD